MNVVIIGGNECMECRYKRVCREYGCKAKVFTKFEGGLPDRIGDPDLIVLFTNPVSHSMARAAKNKAVRSNIVLIQSHSGSCNALKNILRNTIMSFDFEQDTRMKTS
ncbi:hypothetical protein AGMMS4952_27240 [Spirochaetia bacterium]|nr:hypothetical protein AGMMS4952_27240 [Spirochaetia bacterium]